jgi:hypothetical protein
MRRASNNFLWPLYVAQSEALYAIGQNNARFGLPMVGAVVVTIPVLISFGFAALRRPGHRCDRPQWLATEGVTQ